MKIDDLKKFYNGKKVFVTGHSGFKGTWLCKILTMVGADVYGYSLEPTTEPSVFRILKVESLVHSIMGDVRDYEKLKDTIREVSPDYIFHLAAQPIVRKSYRFPRETFETNVMGTVNILECLRQFPDIKGFLNVTTDKVYENNGGAENHPFKEEEKLDGYDPYSNSKSCSELVTHSYNHSFFNSSDSVKISTARAGNVIGGGDFASDRIIPDCVRAASNGECIKIRNAYSIRPYQHVLEPLNVYLTIMMMQDKDASKAGYYNVGPDNEDCVTTGELADLFVKYWGGDNACWEKLEEHDAPHEAGFLMLDNTKIKKEFAYKPVWHIEDAINATVDWYKVWHKGGDCNIITEKQIMEYLIRM